MTTHGTNSAETVPMATIPSTSAAAEPPPNSQVRVGMRTCKLQFFTILLFQWTKKFPIIGSQNNSVR